jgi:SPP1 gp7 family putative phage head morphogenesis protein
MAKLLTIKRAKWAEQRSKPMFKGAPLVANAAIADKYKRRLFGLIDQLTKDARRVATEIYNSGAVDIHTTAGADVTASGQANLLLGALEKKFKALFRDAAKKVAPEFVGRVDTDSAKSLYSSIKQMSGGLSLKTSVETQVTRDVLKLAVSENVDLIKSVGDQYLNKIKRSVYKSITSGDGLQTILKTINKTGEVTQRRAELIARDQTSKVYSQVNKVRMEKIGLKKFEWMHSGGGAHPREDHIKLDGKVFSFSNLPVIDSRTGGRGVPGQAINCRCRAIPVFDFDNDEVDK